MVRKLKYHEKKLLKKVDFISWKEDNTIREVKILKKYHIQKREDYTKYNKLAGAVKSVAYKLKDLNPRDPFRNESTAQLLEKFSTDAVPQSCWERTLQKQYTMGLIPTRKNLVLCDKVNASAFCRRRLPVIMVKLRMAQHIEEAAKLVEQGHVRVGPEVVTDSAFLVTRHMEDFVTWTDTSKIKKFVMDYNEERDDFDLV